MVQKCPLFVNVYTILNFNAGGYFLTNQSYGSSTLVHEPFSYALLSTNHKTADQSKFILHRHTMVHQKNQNRRNLNGLCLDDELLFETKMTKFYSKILLMKSSGSNFIFLPVFYLIMWVMKAPKNFGKITILKI